MNFFSCFMVWLLKILSQLFEDKRRTHFLNINFELFVSLIMHTLIFIFTVLSFKSQIFVIFIRIFFERQKVILKVFFHLSQKMLSKFLSVWFYSDIKFLNIEDQTFFKSWWISNVISFLRLFTYFFLNQFLTCFLRTSSTWN